MSDIRFEEMLINNLKEELKELKQQLAEKDEVIANYKIMYESVVRTCGNDAKEIKKLKKQNDDYADSLTKVLNENADLVFKLAEKQKEYKESVEKILSSRDKLVLEYSQDKLSFAVEQLQWLKEKVDNAKIHKINMINTHELYEILDNQIKQLKEMK